MGFWDAFGKIIQGKPVFDGQEKAPGAPQQEGVSQQATAPGAPTEEKKFDLVGTKKELPVVQIERYEVKNNGNRMEIDVFIKNRSNSHVLVDKLKLLGHIQEADRWLKPGEWHEFRIYKTDRLDNTAENKIELWYKNDQGDYFCAYHMLEFIREADNTYRITRIKFVPPVKDI